MTVLLEDHGYDLISIGEPRRHRMTVEPRTFPRPWREALLARVGRPDHGWGVPVEAIEEIESEARAAALREVAEKVRAMKPLDSGFNDHYYRGHEIARASVLAILTEATDTSATRAVGASE